ncbi:unnamed protein product [Porites evermanni]|uniref:Uncharacterized protein n=1 Tax=Porites evermanni TaxID=104178 RepID=A0ABN8SS62_9CNID|nr:unnamed protein product [Porites evermanni]
MPSCYPYRKRCNKTDQAGTFDKKKIKINCCDDDADDDGEEADGKVNDNDDDDDDDDNDDGHDDGNGNGNSDACDDGDDDVGGGGRQLIIRAQTDKRENNVYWNREDSHKRSTKET